MASLQIGNQDDDGKDGKELDSAKRTPSSPLVVEAIINIQESSSPTRKQPWPKSYSYWIFLVLSSLSSVLGGIAGSILMRFYFVHGGSRKWVNTCVQTAAWPINLVPILILQYCRQKRPAVWSGGTSAMTYKVAGTYVAIGCIIACDNFLYSWGLAYLPLSTSTILFSTQLAFNSVFAYFLVGQRFTPFILNSVILETIAGVLLGVHAQSDIPQGTTHTQYVMGFIVTVLSSAIYGLILCLLELTFSKVVGKANFLTVLETLTFTSAVATVVSLGGMWINGDFRAMVQEARAFDAGPFAYTMTLVFTAISWQAFWLGTYGFVFLTSALMACVFNTAFLPVVPIFATFIFHDNFSAIKAISLVLSVWGFSSYVYGGYLQTKSSNATRQSLEREEEGERERQREREREMDVTHSS